jgi:anti-anti-sigma factor
MALLDIDGTDLDDRTVVLGVKGYLDAFSVTAFRQAAADYKLVPKLIIKLDTTFLDSAGLHALVGDQGGEAAVVCTHPRIAHVLRATGFDRVVTLSQTVDQARAALDLHHNQMARA